MRLSERFVDNCILINSASESKEAILNELVDTLCKAYKLEHRDEIFEAVWNREQSRSTGIGCGLAVPHAKIDYVDRMCMVAATVEKAEPNKDATTETKNKLASMSKVLRTKMSALTLKNRPDPFRCNVLRQSTNETIAP